MTKIVVALAILSACVSSASANGDRVKWRSGIADVWLTWTTTLATPTLTFNDPWAGLVRALCGLPDRQALHSRLTVERITLHCPDAVVGHQGAAPAPPGPRSGPPVTGVTLDAAIQKLRELDWSGEDWPMGVPDDLADQARACETP